MDNNPQNQQPQPPNGELAKSDYSYGTPVTPYQGQPGNQQPQPGFPQPDQKQQAGYPQPINIQQAYQQPQYGQQISARPRRDPNVAFLLELLGYVGFLGFGHIYAGNFIGGIILLLFGWGIVGFAFVVAGILSLGLGFCLLLPVLAAVPLLSGFWARSIAIRNNRYKG